MRSEGSLSETRPNFGAGLAAFAYWYPARYWFVLSVFSVGMFYLAFAGIAWARGTPVRGRAAGNPLFAVAVAAGGAAGNLFWTRATGRAKVTPPAA